MMTGKSPSINSKFKLTYQFLLKILRNPDHELNQFLNLSLFSQDNDKQIESYKAMAELKEKHVLNMPESDQKNIKEYYRQVNYDNFRGNQRKKASIRWEDKQDIPQFKKRQPVYDKYLGKRSGNREMENMINFQKSFVNEDVEKWWNT